MGILDKFLKNNKFYLELDNEKETYKWSTKISEKANPKETDAKQVKSDKVSPEDNGGQQKKVETGEVAAEDNQSATKTVNTSYGEEPAWVKSLYITKEKEEEVVEEKTFAAESVIAKPRPNRRPGGSINKFRDLARGMK